MTITEATRVGDIAAELPSSVRVFQQHGIDFCCGGKMPLAIACREHGLDFAEVARAIDASRDVPDHDAHDWTREPLGALVDHIVATYHQPLRGELPRLRALSLKVAHVHGSKASFLARLDAIVEELSSDLFEHMHKEEMVLFPAIHALESGALGRPIPIDAPIAVMEHEHDQAGVLLSEMRALTGGYVVPEWGCATVRALYGGLAELEAAMHVHVHLENNVLFPRALRQLATVGA